MRHLIRRFTKDESGASMMEYAIIVALISVVSIGAITAIGKEINTDFKTIANYLKCQEAACS